MTPSQPRLQLPKINTMASCPSRIHHPLVSFFVSNPRHHVLSNASAFICGTALLPNDDILPTVYASTEFFEENLLSNGILLPNSAHMSVSSLYQFVVLTPSVFYASSFQVVSPLVISFPCGSSQCGAKGTRPNPQRHAMIKRLQVISTSGNVTRTHLSYLLSFKLPLCMICSKLPCLTSL
jgi:hypothetical protein